jgi:hypothetical protein
MFIQQGPVLSLLFGHFRQFFGFEFILKTYVMAQICIKREVFLVKNANIFAIIWQKYIKKS